MSTGRQGRAGTFLRRARDLALTLSVFGGVQILLSLSLWPILFRSHPQGFAMALTLVGFGGWFAAFVTSFRRTRLPRSTGEAYAANSGAAEPGPSSLGPPNMIGEDDSTMTERLKTQVDRTGCGTVLFLSGLLPLGLAFVLRIQADMQSGKTWNEIFPTVP
jgi:hypothetical protein